MAKSRILEIVLGLIALTFGFSLSVKAQADCVYGFRIYVRNEAGKAIENAKLEVRGLSQKDRLPPNVKSYMEKSGVYNIHNFGGTTIDGDFLLKISVNDYESDERRIKFPVCEMQSFELVLRPIGSTEQASFERLFTVHGKVFDEEMKPFGNAKVEAKSADGRVYQTSSNAYGFYEIDLPKGIAAIRVTDSRIPDVVFENFKIEKNYSVLNVPVCLKCKQNESKN
jgi:hypothetical protein